MVCWISGAVIRVTRPAPARAAPIVARYAAPGYSLDPATVRTRPWDLLVANRDLSGRWA